MRSKLGFAPDHDVEVWLARGGLVVSFVLAVSVPLGAIGLLIVVARPVFIRRRRTRAQQAAITRQLPELVDLYAVALRSGHNVATATHQVARWGDGVVVDALRSCLAQSSRGRPLTDGLQELPGEFGEPLRPLIRLLVASDRDGVSIIEPLAVLAADLRLRRRRQAEVAARRIPIAMLFPLVVCILPAFMLLTVVPTLIEALSSLDS